MVRSAVTAETLVATIDGAGVALWLHAPNDDPLALSGAVTTAFGYSVRRYLPDRPTLLELTPEAGSIVGSQQVRAVTLSATALGESILGGSALHRRSSSIRWLSLVGDLAKQLITSGRVLPSLTTAGLRWSAKWVPVEDEISGRLVSELVQAAPAVVFAGSDIPRADQVSLLLGELVDGIARLTLTETEWRPPLPRSRASSIVALRRFAQALQHQDHVFVGDSVAHEHSLTTWSSGLSGFAGIVGGAPEVTFRALLQPPDQANDPWTLLLEVVRADGLAVGFDQIWTGHETAHELAEGSSLIPLRNRMRQLVDGLGGRLAVLAPLAAQAQPASLELSAQDVGDFLTGPADICRRAGLEIVGPSDLHMVDARLTAEATPRDLPASNGLGTAILDVDWGLALGDIELSPEEIDDLMASPSDLVAVRGTWVLLDRNKTLKTLRRLDEQRRNAAELTPGELLRETIAQIELGADDDLSAEGPLASLLAGLPDDQLQETHEPTGFVGSLRPYQRRALSWLQFLARLGLGGCLADDMGLGKTPTALAHLLDRTQRRSQAELPRRPHLIVCPLSVVANWEAETARFTPELTTLIVHGPERPRGEELIATAAQHDIVITTYGTTTRIADELAPIDWDVVVCDEAQAIKNHQTNAAKAIRSLRAEQRIALTGTPVENRLTELWAILDALNEGMLGGITWFRRTFANPIDAGDEAALAALKRLTTPFLLRRTKLDRSLVPDLPDKIEQIVWATLTIEQAELYQSIVNDFLETVTTSTGMERRGLVLATLTKLKQVCNHPAHVLNESTIGAGGRSGKLDRFDELIDVFLETGDKTIVFTQYRQMGLLLQTYLHSRLEIEVPFLHGGTTRSHRDRMVKEFQGAGGPPVQLISLRAGGTGLNLTAASRVIHYDRWWNPAVEDQATDRTWRIGQTQTVFVHKLVCRGTLEERINDLLEEKRALANAVVGSGDAWLTELTTDELRELLRLDLSATVDSEPALSS